MPSQRGVSVAVTGLIANESPAPGVGIARSLRARAFSGRITGLLYDALEAGAFLEGLLDHTYIIPYPSEGGEDFFQRLLYIREHSGLDVLIPTLDAELLPLIRLARRLARAGVRTFLPTAEQFQLRGKDRLYDLKTRHGLPVPRARALYDAGAVWKLRGEFEFPLFVKGVFYEAYRAAGEAEALAHFQKLQARWGLPVVIQEAVDGEEYDVAALGDGRGGTVGAVAMRKMQLSDKGKAWAGVTVADERLIKLCRRTIAALKWRGPLELEVIKARRDGTYHILEINPRFPAWVFLAQGAGQNLPHACLRLALGEKASPMSSYQAGIMFVRAAQDIVCPVSRLERISVQGEWHAS